MTIDFSAYGDQSVHIHGFKCLKCGKLHYPAPMVCSGCGGHRDPVTGKHWEEFPLEGACTLLTWTRVWNLPEGFNRKFMLFGMVQFGNGLRASGRLECDGDPVIGSTLTASAEEADERPGNPVKVFVFR